MHGSIPRSLIAVGLLLGACAPVSGRDDGDAFWKHWGDGRAELSGYDLAYPRYGAIRHGKAVAIFVTETFAGDDRVKHERGDRPESLRYPVMKLNLVQDFPTGIYDYNMMTSVFIALAPAHGRGAGSPTKVSFSSQEWCGHVYAQLLFDEKKVRHEVHSYFDGEADREDALDYPADGISEDALLPWARGFGGPALAPGDTRTVRLLRSLEQSRLRHREPAWVKAVLSRAAATETVEVPAGTFEARRYDVEPDPSAAFDQFFAWSIWVEDVSPHRIVRWTRADGVEARLLASERSAYWEMNGPEHAAAPKRLGLAP